MANNLERFRKDLDRLVNHGELLLNVMIVECYPEQRRLLKKETVASLPRFNDDFQSWYSRSTGLRFTTPSISRSGFHAVLCAR